MRIIILPSLVIVLLFLFTPNARAQNQPVYKHYGGTLEYKIDHPSNYPPLRTDMPYDVMLGYVYFDSLSRTYGYDSLLSIVRNLTYSDTLKYAMKFLYRLNDYDPITFFQYLYCHPGGYPNLVSPSTLLLELSRQAAKVYPDSFQSVCLCLVDAICHIRISDTSATVDTTIPFLDKVILVTAEVLDTIKGKVLPSCAYDIYSAKRNNEQKNLLEPNCLQFEYRLSWENDINSTSFIFNKATLYDTSGKSWLQKDKEYIVFLAFTNMGRDTTSNYAIFYPGLQHSTYIGLYPIQDGKVLDENNDFGFGTGLTVSEFKIRLRQRIHNMLMN